MASVENGDGGNIDALLKAAEILEKKLYPNGGYGTAETIRNINAGQFVEWLSSGEQANAEISMDSNIASTIHVELANLIQMSGCQKIADLQAVFGPGHKSSSSKSKPTTLNYPDDDPVFTYHPSTWKRAAPLLRSDCTNSKTPQNHCHILTAATGVSQLSESSLVGVTGDEPDGLSNTSDDVCMDNSSQDSFSGTMLPVHSSTNQLAACNASLGSEYNGNAVDALDNKSQYSNCRLRSALLTPYSPGSEIHSNDTRQSSQFPHRESSGIILPATQRSMTGSLPSEAFSNRTSPQKILEVICGTRETLNDLDQHEPKLGTSDSPQNISSVHHQTSWSAPPSVSSSSCATPDKEFFDVPNQSEIPQPLYPVRPSRFSFSSLPVKKRKLDWKLEADSFPSNRQSSDKHLHQLRKTSINSPSDFIITTSTLLPTLDHDISTHSSTDCSSSCIPERRQSVGDSPISEITQQQLDTPKPTPPLLRTCSIPVNTEQRIMNTSSKTPDPLVFHNHHPIEAKKSPRTHHQNHFSVLARTLTGSDNNDNVSHNNSFHLKQYLSESVLVRNSLDCSQILKHNVYGDNKTQPSSLANTFDLYTTTNYYDNIYRKAEDLYTSKDNYLTPTTPTRMSVTPDLLFRSPRNTLKHRFNVCNGSNNNSNNQSSSSASVSPINVSAITNMNKVTSLYHKTDSNCKQDFAKTLPSVNSDPYVLDHQNHHASNGSPTERKHGGLIQNRCYNEHSSQLSYTPTPKEDTSYVMNSFSRKRPSYMMDATLLKSNTTNRLSQVQDKNRHYQQPSSIINQKITVPDAATTTSTVVNQHFNNALVQTEVKNERKRILANSSPITIDSALFNKLSVDQSKASYLEPSNNTLPISLSPSSILSNQVNVSGAHVIMMLSPSTTVPTSLHLSNTDEITSSDIKRMSNNSTGLQYSLTSSHIENFNSFGANLNSSKSSFPLLLVSASSSASAAALAEAAARATGAPPTSLVPVPVQVTTYIPASQTEDNNGQLNIQGENSNSQNANSNTSNQHFILSVMMNDSDEKSSSIPLGIRKIPLVLSAPIHPPNSNTTPSNIIHIDNKQHLSSTTASKYIPLINSSSGGKLTHQTA